MTPWVDADASTLPGSGEAMGGLCSIPGAPAVPADVERRAPTPLARGKRDPQFISSWALNSFGVPLDDFLPGAR